MTSPFTRAVRRARLDNHYTFAELSAATGGARSSAWLNTLLSGGSQWGNNLPPSDIDCARFADLLECTWQEVKEMVCEEWYGVTAWKPSARVAAWQTRLDTLNEEDALLVETLLDRLTTPTSAHLDAVPGPVPP